MKASVVLKRYALGERNFRSANLRGQSFKGQDLSGADFSDADLSKADFSDASIYSTNFTGANLTGANFTGAKCGLQRRWIRLLTIIAWFLAGISGFVSIVVAAKFFPIFDNSSNFGDLILNLVCLIVVAILSKIFIRQEIGMATGALVIGVVLIALGVGIIPIAILAGIVGFIVGEMAVAVAEPRAGFIALLSAVVGVIAGVAAVVEELGLATIAVAAVGVLVVKGVSDGWHEMKGKERDMWIHPLVVGFAAMGGTSFFGANLTDAIFTEAKLKSTDLRLANITRVRWYKATMLNRTLVGDTYLQYKKVRQWFIGEGKDKNFDRLNLRGVNFQGIKNLTDASFICTDLSETNLRDADLSGAKLVQTQLDRTDLTGATLTGAFIEGWRITPNTLLNGVKCNYIFMRLPPDKRPDWLTLSKAESENSDPRCKPDNGEFKGNDFANFIKLLVDTLDLYHNQDIDPREIVIARKKLSGNNLEANLQFEEREVKAEEDQFKAKRNASDTAIQNPDNNSSNITIYAQGDVNVGGDRKIEGDYVEGNKTDSSRNQNISNSTVNNSGAIAFNLGDISGTVANTINQLPNFADEPDKKELKELLKQLQTAVLEAELDEEEKAESLDQVQKIASSLNNSQDGVVKKTVKQAMKLLLRTAAALPKGAAMVTICNQLPELIEKIFN